jgi:hypothetical protein
MVSTELVGNRDFAQVEADLDLAERLLDRASEYGDPRDADVAGLREALEGYRLLMVAAREVRSDPETGFAALEKAVLLLPQEIVWQLTFLEAIRRRGERDRASAHVEWLLTRYPDSAPLLEFRDSLTGRAGGAPEDE